MKKWFSGTPESMVKKLSFDGSGPPQKMCPKSGQKIVKKCFAVTQESMVKKLSFDGSGPHQKMCPKKS